MRVIINFFLLTFLFYLVYTQQDIDVNQSIDKLQQFQQIIKGKVNSKGSSRKIDISYSDQDSDDDEINFQLATTSDSEDEDLNISKKKTKKLIEEAKEKNKQNSDKKTKQQKIEESSESESEQKIKPVPKQKRQPTIDIEESDSLESSEDEQQKRKQKKQSKGREEMKRKRNIEFDEDSDDEDEDDFEIRRKKRKDKITSTETLKRMEMFEQEDSDDIAIIKKLNKKRKAEKQRLEQERLEQERLEQERLEQERLEQERLEQERLEQERLEQERLEKEKDQNGKKEKKKKKKKRHSKEKMIEEEVNEVTPDFMLYPNSDFIQFQQQQQSTKQVDLQKQLSEQLNQQQQILLQEAYKGTNNQFAQMEQEYLNKKNEPLIDPIFIDEDESDIVFPQYQPQPQQLIKQQMPQEMLMQPTQQQQFVQVQEKEDILKTISLPDDENDGRIRCEGTLNQACQLCQTSYGYQIDDDNWYLIGLQHGYKKEFQMLLDQIKEKLGEGQLFLAFSDDDRHICLVSNQLQTDIHLDSALLYFTNVGLEEYLPRKPFFQLPQNIRGKSFQLIATYNIDTAKYYYSDFNISVVGDLQHELSQGGVIQCSEAQFEEINISATYKGIVRYHQEDLEFEYRTQNGNEISSLIIKNVQVPEYRGLIMGISEKYLGNYYLTAVEKHLQKKNYRGNLVIETIGMNEEFKVKFNLRKE